MQVHRRTYMQSCTHVFGARKGHMMTAFSEVCAVTCTAPTSPEFFIFTLHADLHCTTAFTLIVPMLIYILCHVCNRPCTSHPMQALRSWRRYSTPGGRATPCTAPSGCMTQGAGGSWPLCPWSGGWGAKWDKEADYKPMWAQMKLQNSAGHRYCK